MEWWSWLAQIIETIVGLVLLPLAVWQLSLQVKATRDQTRATLLQTIATVISWVQAEEIRQSRRLLYDLEAERKISSLPINTWLEDWKQAADRVSQCFNSAAIVAKQDSRLQDIWIRQTRQAILKCWTIAQPRILERRAQEPHIWKEFDWLVERARQLA